MVQTRWVVLLEVDGSAGDHMELTAARRILEAIADDHRTGLYSSERVAFQAWVDALTASEALASVTARWLTAAQDSGVRGWRVVRAEVLTPEEFERDCEEPDVPAEPAGSCVDHRDIAPPNAQEEELLRRAFHDSLTQLADKELFRSQVEHAVVRHRHSDSLVAVLYLDLDEFRWVNRALGARVGDDVLVAVAQRIAGGIRPGDTAARVGGDRFAVLLENVSPTSATVVAERISQAIRAPHDVGGRAIVVTASVGLAFSPPADSADALIQNAEAAMRSAKRLGTGGTAAFDPDDEKPGVTRVTEPGRRPETTAYVQLLQRAAAVANDCETLEEAARIVLRELCIHTGWSVGRLYVRDANNPNPTTPVVSTHPPEHGAETSAPPGDVSLRAQVAATRQPAWALDVTDGGWPGRTDEGPGVATRLTVAFPVVAGQEVAAVLELVGEGASEPDPSLVEVVASVGIQLGRVVERSRARATVVTCEARLQALLEASADVIAVIGCDGTLAAQYEARGSLRSPSEDPPEPLLDRIHPEDLPIATAHLNAASAAPIGSRFRCRVRHADGSWRWMDLTANGLLHDPAVGGIVLTASRVADPTHDERVQGGRFAPSGTWRFDISTARSEWSEDLYAILGLSPDETVAGFDVFLAAVHPADRARVVAASEHATTSEGPVSVEFRIVRPDGTERWLHATGTGTRDTSGRLVARHGVVLDITERKEEEERLAAIKHRWSDLLSDSADMLTLVADDGAVLFSLAPDGGPFSPATSWEDDVRVADLVHPDDVECMVALLADVASGPGRAGPVELRVRCANGSWRWVESVADNFLEDPIVGAIVLKSRDVTKRLEERLAGEPFDAEIDGLGAEAVAPPGLVSPGPTFAQY